MRSARRSGSATPEVDAVLVDLGNVLVRVDHGKTLAALERATGVSPERLREAIFGGPEQDFDLGKTSEVEFFREVERRGALPRLSDDVWRPAWRDIFEPIPEALDALARLRPDVPSALLSNTNALHWEGVQRVCDVTRLLSTFVLSFEVHVRKPDPAIWRLALDRLSASADRAVFADDRPDFVSAARELGIDAFVVSGPSDLEAGLLERGLLL